MEGSDPRWKAVKSQGVSFILLFSTEVTLEVTYSNRQCIHDLHHTSQESEVSLYYMCEATEIEEFVSLVHLHVSYPD